MADQHRFTDITAGGSDETRKVEVDDGFQHLERLADELDARGLLARVVHTQSGRTFVRVINPNATSLAENVTCLPQATPTYYWWSWGERMHKVDDPAGAATKVARVLAAVSE